MFRESPFLREISRNESLSRWRILLILANIPTVITSYPPAGVPIRVGGSGGSALDGRQQPSHYAWEVAKTVLDNLVRYCYSVLQIFDEGPLPGGQ